MSARVYVYRPLGGDQEGKETGPSIHRQFVFSLLLPPLLNSFYSIQADAIRLSSQSVRPGSLSRRRRRRPDFGSTLERKNE